MPPYHYLTATEYPLFLAVHYLAFVLPRLLASTSNNRQPAAD